MYSDRLWQSNQNKPVRTALTQLINLGRPSIVPFKRDHNITICMSCVYCVYVSTMLNSNLCAANNNICIAFRLEYRHLLIIERTAPAILCSVILRQLSECLFLVRKTCK